MKCWPRATFWTVGAGYPGLPRDMIAARAVSRRSRSYKKTPPPTFHDRKHTARITGNPNGELDEIIPDASSVGRFGRHRSTAAQVAGHRASRRQRLPAGAYDCSQG